MNQSKANVAANTVVGAFSSTATRAIEMIGIPCMVHIHFTALLLFLLPQDPRIAKADIQYDRLVYVIHQRNC